MNVVDTAKEQVKHLVEVVTDKVTDAATTESRIQAITIGRPRADVIRLFQDAELLAEVVGPTPCPPATWAPTSATSPEATPSPSGKPVPSA